MQLTIDDIREAYRKTGLKPARGTYLSNGRACAAGAVAVANGVTGAGEEWEILPQYRWCVSTYGVYFIDGLVCGFDGFVYSDVRTDDPDYVAGYKLGEQAAMELLS